MAYVNCPYCGKPLKPGIKFCGNCGKQVPATPPESLEAAPAHAAMVSCPHCGKPVRAGAKFCNNCGKSINQDAASAAAGASEPGGQVTVRQIPSASPPRPLPAPPAQPAQPAKKPRSKAPMIILGGLLVVLCGVAAVGAFLYIRDPFNWFGKAIARLTDTPVPLSTDTPLPSLTATSLPVVAPSVTLPPTGMPSPTVEVITTSTQTPQVTLVETNVLTAPITSVFVVLEDDFNSGVNTNWDTWGKPRPKVSSGPGDSWLDLPVPDAPGEAGITSKQEFILDTGAEIVIQGELNKTYPGFKLVLDWDSVKTPRGPDTLVPGIIHLEISKNQLLLSAPLTRSSCEKENNGTEAHIYRLRSLADQGLELYLDQDTVPTCTLVSLGQPPVAGRITFTGVGWVTYVRVTTLK